MDANQMTKKSMEEQILRAMSMSIYGKQLTSRCRVLSPSQRAELEAAARKNLIEDSPEKKTEKSNNNDDV